MAAQYPNNVVTKKGLAAIAESVATKKPLIFTKVVVGDGQMPVTNLADLTSIISKKMELPITSYLNEGNGQFLVRAALSNSALEVGFFPREVALYAKVSEEGTEILYSYTNGENNVGYIPDKTTPIESEIYNIRTVIGNASNIIAKLSDDTFITVLDLTQHKNDADTHEPLMNKWINSSCQKFKNAVLEILDIQYKLGNEGYVRAGCVGGLTLQWGDGNLATTQGTVTFAIEFKSPFQMVANDVGGGSHALGATPNTKTGIVYCKDNTAVTFRYLAIGLSN